MTTVPIIVGPTGRVNTPPATLRANFIAGVAAVVPGYTANLPASMIEDMTSTAVGALVTCDQLLTDNINCLDPLTANPYVINQLGVLYGVPQGTDTNTSVYVVFSGTPGFVISQGFIVSDGTYQYTVQAPGGVISGGGASPAIYCVATVAGTWAVPAGTVTTLISSVPSAITLVVTNPLDGLPSVAAQTLPDYQAQVIQAGLATSTGGPTLLKVALGNVSGVQSRLISVQQQSPGWKIICGGGDPYEVGFAIYNALGDISNLVGSVIEITAITQATLGVVTTDLNHGLTTGQNDVYIAGVVGMTAANGGPYTVVVLTETTFTFGVNTSGFGAYVSGGVITPNPRNVSVNLLDYPDTYTVDYVGNPPQQSVAISLVWTADAPNLISADSIAQLAVAPIAAYINSIIVGAPINLLALDNVFQLAVVSVLSTQYIINLAWTVTINTIVTAPTSGTRIVVGDPESYFYCLSSSVTVTQG